MTGEGIHVALTAATENRLDARRVCAPSNLGGMAHRLTRPVTYARNRAHLLSSILNQHDSDSVMPVADEYFGPTGTEDALLHHPNCNSHEIGHRREQAIVRALAKQYPPPKKASGADIGAAVF